MRRWWRRDSRRGNVRGRGEHGVHDRARAASAVSRGGQLRGLVVPDRAECGAGRPAEALRRAATREAAVSEPDVEERFLALERAAQLHTLIRMLEQEQQHLLALRYGAGLAFDEIGTVVGAAPGTVRVRMHRILEQKRRRYPDDD